MRLPLRPLRLGRVPAMVIGVGKWIVAELTAIASLHVLGIATVVQVAMRTATEEAATMTVGVGVRAVITIMIGGEVALARGRGALPSVDCYRLVLDPRKVNQRGTRNDKTLSSAVRSCSN